MIGTITVEYQDPHRLFYWWLRHRGDEVDEIRWEHGCRCQVETHCTTSRLRYCCPGM